jgi:flagellar biosynthesis protein FliQ
LSQEDTVQLAAVQLDQGVEDAFASVMTFIPKLVAFLLILLIGYFVAKAIGKAIDAVLERVGFDRAVERGGVKKALAKSQYDASDIISKVVFYTLFLLVLQFAFSVFGPSPISEGISSIIAFLPKLVVAIVLVVVAAAIATMVKDLVSNALGGLSYGKTLATVSYVTIFAIGVFMALNQVEIAPAIVNGLFYFMLVTIGGILIVSVGGGGISAMSQQWQKALNKVEDEAPRMREQIQAQRSTQPYPSEPTPVEAYTQPLPAAARRR